VELSSVPLFVVEERSVTIIGSLENRISRFLRHYLRKIIVSRKITLCGGDPPDPIQMAGRRLSCETIMFHQSVADRLGLNVTDHKCLDFLLLDGPLTAGELAQRTSLTTGAITSVLDRLERAGFVQRQPDPNDRRRVIVHPIVERLSQVGMLFADLSSRMHEMATRYSPAELTLIIDFMHRSCDILREATIAMREGTAEAEAKVK
jgi:DNA-binding MarR family transcriptional regulator